jgi:hypothetical protein
MPMASWLVSLPMSACGTKRTHTTSVKGLEADLCDADGGAR